MDWILRLIKPHIPENLKEHLSLSKRILGRARRTISSIMERERGNGDVLACFWLWLKDGSEVMVYSISLPIYGAPWERRGMGLESCQWSKIKNGFRPLITIHLNVWLMMEMCRVPFNWIWICLGIILGPICLCYKLQWKWGDLGKTCLFNYLRQFLRARKSCQQVSMVFAQKIECYY